MEKKNVDIWSLVVYSLPVLVCIVVAIVQFGAALKIAAFRDEAGVAIGVMVEHKLKYDSEEHLKYFGRYEYEVDGRTYSVWAKKGTSKTQPYEKAVYYAKDDPQDAVTEIGKGDLYMRVAVGVLFLVLTAVMAYVSRREYRKYHCDI